MENDLNKKITIEVEVTSDGQQQLTQYKAALDSLRVSIGNLSNPLNGLSNNIALLDKGLSKASNALEKLNRQSKENESTGNKLKESVKSWHETFEALDKIVGIVKKGFVSLEGAMTGGLSIIAAYLPEITNWISSLIKGKEGIDQVKLSQDKMNEALESSDYSNAIEQINDLKINVDLAKKGFLNKNEVLKQYNDTLGQTMGQVTNLDKAESNILNKGDAYIKMTLLKATAQLALQDAAKKAYEAEQDKNKSDWDSLTFLDKAADVLKFGAASVSTAGLGGVFEMPQIAADDVKIAKKRREEAISDAEKDMNALLEIAKKLKKDAASIAKDNGLDLLAGAGGTAGVSGNAGQLKQQRADALKETEKLFSDSRAHQLQATYDAYGNETIAENKRYRDELARLKELLTQKLISREQYAKVSQQLDNEHHANIASIIEKYRQQDEEKVKQATTSLEEMKINAMKDGAEKQKAERKLQHNEALQQIDNADKELKERAKKLSLELGAIVATNPFADTSAIASQLNSINKLLDINIQKRQLINSEAEKTNQEDEQKNKTDKSNAETLKKLKDKVDDDTDAADAAKTSGAKFKAERTLIDDKYHYDLLQAGNNAEKKKEIERKYQKDIKDLTQKAGQERKDFEFKEAQEISNAAFSIVTANIKHQSDAKIASLEKDKTNELNNSSLTSAQKLAIENKYKKQEAAVKVKAFKDEQKASIAQALINGAIAVTKAEAQTGVLGALVIPGIIAETAIQVAKIASQKPPAYALGGLHYQSDGRGGALPGYSRTDNMNAYLRSGEGIVVSEAMQVPWARNLVSAINVGFGGRDFSIANPGYGYAVGGIFTDGGDANRYYSQPVNDQKNLANTIAYQMINNFPPVYVDVKDINNQQNILAQTINRVNL